MLPSTLYNHTVKKTETPSGRKVLTIRASVRRTSETETTGWPTPVVRDHRNSSGNGSNPRDLPRTVPLAGWPTTSCNNDRTGNPESAMSMQRQDGSKVQQRLQDFAAITGPTRLTVSGDLLTGSDAGTISTGQLNPEHSRWLMGCPPAWAQAAPGYSDWQNWQDLMRQASSEQNPTESEV